MAMFAMVSTNRNRKCEGFVMNLSNIAPLNYALCHADNNSNVKQKKNDDILCAIRTPNSLPSPRMENGNMCYVSSVWYVSVRMSGLLPLNLRAFQFFGRYKFIYVQNTPTANPFTGKIKSEIYASSITIQILIITCCSIDIVLGMQVANLRLFQKKAAHFLSYHYFCTWTSKLSEIELCSTARKFKSKNQYTNICFKHLPHSCHSDFVGVIFAVVHWRFDCATWYCHCSEL